MAAVSFSKPEAVNSAVERAIFTKRGTLADTDLLRTRALSNRNRRLIRDVNGRNLENFNEVITMPPMVRFAKNRTISSIPI